VSTPTLVPKFLMGFVPIDPMNVRTKKFVALPVPEIIAIAAFVSF